MSGDGFTSGGLTGWFGASGSTTGASQPRYKDMSFIIGQWDGFWPQQRTFLGATASVRTGEIGYSTQLGGTASGTADIIQDSEMFPLRIRTSSVTLYDGPISTLGYAYSPRILLNNLSTSTGLSAPKFNSSSTDYYNPTYSTTYLIGNWPFIYQRTGALTCTQSTISITGSSWYTYWSIVSMTSTDTNKTKSFVLSHQSMAENAYIWGNFSATGQANSSASVTVNGYSGAGPDHALVLGSFHEGKQPIFSTLTLGGGTAGRDPYIKFGSAKVNALLADGGTIAVSELASASDQVIIRDGYLRDGSLLMYHPGNPGWQNFKLGDPAVATDPGLRIDSRNVEVKCFNGQTLITQAGTQGLIAYPFDTENEVRP
jgi:hypothetical protein